MDSMKKEKMLQEIISGYGIKFKSIKFDAEIVDLSKINISDIANLVMSNISELFKIALKDQTNEKEILKIILEISDNSRIWQKRLSKNTSPEIKEEFKKNKSNFREELKKLALEDNNEPE